MNKIEKLKSCPFCGGEAKIEDWTCAYEIGTSIRCSTCGAAIHEGIEDGDGCHDRAVKAWNRRAQDTEARRRRAEQNPKSLTLDELRKMDGEPVWIDYMDGFATWRIIESVDNPDKPYARIHFYETIWKHLFDYGKTWLAYRTKPERSGEE